MAKTYTNKFYYFAILTAGLMLSLLTCFLGSSSNNTINATTPSTTEYHINADRTYSCILLLPNSNGTLNFNVTDGRTKLIADVMVKPGGPDKIFIKDLDNQLLCWTGKISISPEAKHSIGRSNRTIDLCVNDEKNYDILYNNEYLGSFNSVPNGRILSDAAGNILANFQDIIQETEKVGIEVEIIDNSLYTDEEIIAICLQSYCDYYDDFT